MSIWDTLDSTREARPEVLTVIDELLSSHAVTSVHYVGYAHEPVLRLLHQHLGTAFSVMDMPDRYHTGAAFFWDGPGDCPGPDRPEWLEGVLFYQEGGHDADLLIWDTPCHPEQLSSVINRHPPTRLLLVDEACSAASHPAYSWAMFPTYAVGTLNTRNTMNITEQIIAKAKGLLDAEPAGIRYAKLHAAIQAALPTFKHNTIHGALTKIRTTLPEYNPEKGLYRSPKFTDLDAVLPPLVGKTPKQAQLKEEGFYEPFAEWLTNELQEASKAIPLGGNRFKDKWGTPDVIGVLRPKPTDIFTFPLEILSAEIKSDSAGLITAFGQACSYKLFSHRSYIVVPASSMEADISRLDSLCMIFGIGLIVFDAQNPKEPAFKILTRAARHEPDMFYVNKYVREVADELLS